MSEPLSAERLAEIRARAEDEWYSSPAALRDIPDLLAEVDRLRAEVDRLRLNRNVVRMQRDTAWDALERLEDNARRVSRWFSAAQDAHQQPANAPRSHEQTEPGQPATTRQADGTDTGWDGTGE